MKNIQDFDKFLKALVVRTPIDSLGWDSVVHDDALASGDLVFLYVHDVATRWTWMASVERKGFLEAAATGGTLSDKGMDDVRGGLLAAVMKLSGSATAADVTTVHAEHILGVALSLYAGRTQIFRAADGFKDGGHFCVMIYRKDAKAESANIRPFAFPGSPDRPIAAEAFMAAVAQVEQRDRERHPEWLE